MCCLLDEFLLFIEPLQTKLVMVIPVSHCYFYFSLWLDILESEVSIYQCVLPYFPLYHITHMFLFSQLASLCAVFVHVPESTLCDTATVS